MSAAESPVQSMTGAGVARGASELGDVAVEVRSLNGKGLAIKTRLPAACHGLEAGLDKRVRARLRRGTVSLVVQVTAPAPGRDGCFDEARATSVVEQLRALAGRLGLADDLAVSALLAVPGLLDPGAGTASPRVSWEPPEQFAALVDEALDRLLEARRREGAATAASVCGDLDELAMLRERALSRVPHVVGAYREALKARVDEFLAGRGRALRDEDVVKEVALFADRADVSEELQRVGEHLAQARVLLARAGEVGRPLEFLMQEVQREVNTLGAKSRDAEIAQTVVAMKSADERIKEQAANLQ